MTATGMPASSSASPSRMAAGVVPASRARCDASWMTGPSMTGSENGMPTSTASAPAAAAASIASRQPSSPPVT